MGLDIAMDVHEEKIIWEGGSQYTGGRREGEGHAADADADAGIEREDRRCGIEGESQCPESIEKKFR